MTALAAVDGCEAMSMIERDDLAIDLLLSDISMPGIGGLELVAMARARRPALAIVVLSGDNRFALPPDSIGTDVTLVEKPFTLQELTTAVDAALDRGPG